MPKQYTILFPNNINRFRFLITKDNPNKDRKLGRIVLNNIHLFYNEKIETHTHFFVYKGLNKYNHSISCRCGAYTIKPHIVQPSSSGTTITTCIQCGYQLNMRSTSPNVYKPLLIDFNYILNSRILIEQEFLLEDEENKKS